MIPSTVSHYTIEEQLGGGGMGVVYKARDTRLDRWVALKFLPPDLTRNANAKQRFVREAQAASALDHPNICTIYEIDETEDGQIFIAMAFYEGGTLKKKIADGPLDIEDAVDIASQITAGLAQAHQKGIVHRDIKPANIFLTEDGLVKLLDFGLAKLDGKAQLTQTGTTLGTIAYMSPEQIQGREVDSRSDLWSLGVVLYEMLTGHLPFQGAYDQAIAYAIMHSDPNPVALERPEVPDSISNTIQQLLTKDPADRLADGSEILATLQGEGDTAASPTTSHRAIFPALITQRPLLWVGSVIAALTLIVILVFTTGVLRSDLDPNRIMVADFTNRTGDPTLEAVGAMAADWVRQGLLETGFVEVVDEHTSRAVLEYLGASFQPRQLGRETGAGTVVTGTYYLQDTTLQLHVQINDARTRSLIASLDPVQGIRTDIPVLVQHVREGVMTTLAGQLDPRLAQYEGSLPFPPNYAAYQAYLQGMDNYLGNDFVPAAEQFDQASRLDSTFVHAQVWAAKSHAAIASYAMGPPHAVQSPPSGQYNIARIHFTHADSIIRVIDAHHQSLSAYDRYHLAFIRAYRNGELEEMYQTAHQVMDAAPGSQEAIREAAVNSGRTHRHQEAVDLWLQLDPDHGLMRSFDRYHVYLADEYHALGQHKKELSVARAGLHTHPNLWQNVYAEIKALIALGRVEQAFDQVDQAEQKLDSDRFRILVRFAGQECVAHGFPEAGHQLFRKYTTIAEQHLRTIDPVSEDVWLWQYRRALGLFLQEHYQQADSIAATLERDSYGILELQGILAAELGDEETARRKMEEIEASRPDSLLRHFYRRYDIVRSSILAWLGDTEDALQFLERAQPFFDPETPCRFVLYKSLWGYPPYEKLTHPSIGARFVAENTP